MDQVQILNGLWLQNGESEHVLRIFDDEAQALQSARNSSMMLEDAYATGVAVLSKYAEQRDRLKVTLLLPDLVSYYFRNSSL